MAATTHRTNATGTDTHDTHTTTPGTPDRDNDITIPLTDWMQRALYEPMLAVGYLDRAENAPGLYEVYTTGDPYLVDLRLGVCECADFRYRDGPCKHLHRARFATGEVPIPANADQDRIDENIGACTHRD